MVTGNILPIEEQGYDFQRTVGQKPLLNKKKRKEKKRKQEKERKEKK